MKILAAGDLHGDVSVARKLANKAQNENVDLVVLAGDITGDDEKLPGVISPFLEKKKKVLFCLPWLPKSPSRQLLKPRLSIKFFDSFEFFSVCHPELVSGSRRLDSGSESGMTKVFMPRYST